MERRWDGKTVAVSFRDHHPRFPTGVVDIQMGRDAAHLVTLVLKRLQQTTLGMTPGAEELLDALDYVLVADPASVAKHSRMEAGKGMTPDGGDGAPVPFPNPPRDGRGFIRPDDSRRGSEWRDRLPDTGERYS